MTEMTTNKKPWKIAGEAFREAVAADFDLGNQMDHLLAGYEASDEATRGLINWVASALCGYSIPKLLLGTEAMAESEIETPYLHPCEAKVSVQENAKVGLLYN